MSAEATVQQRQGTHGEYADSAPVMQAIKRAIRSGVGYEALPDIMKESLDLFAHKIGRIVTGNPYVLDHWIDIGGYSLLIQQRIEDGVGVKPEYVRPVTPFDIAAQTTLTVTESKRTYPIPVETQLTEAEDRLRNGKISSFEVGRCPMSGALLSVEEFPMRTPGTPEDGGQHARQEPVVPKRGSIWLTDEDVGKQFITYGRDLITLHKNIGGKQELFPYQCNNGRRYSTTGHVSKVDTGDFDFPDMFNIEGRMPA